MTSNFKAKLQESAVSVVPVMLIVVLLHYTLAPLGEGGLARFLAGGVLLILGLTIFLLGADLGMVPFGQRVGSALTRKRSLFLILIASFAIGFAVTIAEPDVQVLAGQVHNVNQAVDKSKLLFMIAAGVGLFLVVGMLRVVFRISLRMVLAAFYALLFLLCAFIDPGFVGIAFDAGGATTGPVTVPFIMALGIGVASAMKKKEGGDSSFGLVGLASIGPVMAVAMLGFLFRSGEQGLAAKKAAAPIYPLVEHFLHRVPHTMQEIALALFPILAIFFVFQVTLLKLPAQQTRRIILGMVYAFIGLVIFMVGVNGGFSPAGRALGIALGQGGSGWGLIPVGFVLGAVVVCAEPAVWVLTEQVEEVSGGYIPRRIMLVALCLSVAVAVVLGMLRVVSGLSIWYVLIPGYALALGLTLFCPPLFTAIAFDSGGVASGPMSATFVLSLTLGASAALGGNPATDAFGMIAMIAMAPLITIQLLGLLFRAKERQQLKKQRSSGNGISD